MGWVLSERLFFQGEVYERAGSERIALFSRSCFCLFLVRPDQTISSYIYGPGLMMYNRLQHAIGKPLFRVIAVLFTKNN